MRQPEPGYRQPTGSTRTLERGVDGRVVRRTVLPGGLRVVTEQVPGTASAAVGVWVGVGSRDEKPAVAGAAHFLEHLLFKGTSNRSAAQIAEEMDDVGGELNAFTAKEHTCYYAHVLDTDLPLAMELLTEVVFDATLALADMETERGVVLDEIAMRDDDPEDVLNEAFYGAVFGDHPLGRSILGSEESITGLTRTALRGFYRRHYCGERTVIAVTGNVEHGTVLRQVRRCLRRLGVQLAGDATPAAPRAGRARVTGAQRLVLSSDDTEQAQLLLGTRALDRHDPRRSTLGVLSAALGGGMSSRLFQQVRERRGLAYQIYSSYTGYADAGHFSVYAGTQPERLGEVVRVIREVLAEVAEHGLTEAEIARGKGQLRGGLVLGLEDNVSRMSRLGKTELLRTDYRAVGDALHDIAAVTVADVAELAADVLRRPMVAAVVGPYADERALPAELHAVVS